MSADSPTSATPDAAFLRDFLAGRDVECPLCGYNLRDLAGDRCPECGDQLILRVNTSEPRLAAPITGLIGLASGAGLNGLLLIYGLLITVIHHPSGLFQFFLCNGVGFAIEGGAMFFWLRQWRNVRRKSAATQWKFAIGCWLLTLANLVWFTMNVK